MESETGLLPAKHFSGFAGRWLVVPQCSAAVFGQRGVAVIADGVVTRRVPLRQLAGNLPARQSKLKQRLPLATPFQCLATFLARALIAKRGMKYREVTRQQITISG